MVNYEGVGMFGSLLADAINKDPRGIIAISDDLLIDQKMIRKHIKQRSRPKDYTLEIYSDYLKIPAGTLYKMLDEDWGTASKRTDFSYTLINIMFDHGWNRQILSEKIGVSENTISKWINGESRISNRNYIKLMHYVCKEEGLL